MRQPRSSGCWQPIDYRLRHPHPAAFELDHAIPVGEEPALALVPSNFLASQAVWNRRRAAGEIAPPRGVPSED